MQYCESTPGAQFTSKAFTDLLKDHNIAISMGGRRRVQDNISIERLWWTVNTITFTSGPSPTESNR